MYITRNMFDEIAQYVDIKDDVFFNACIDAAVLKYEHELKDKAYDIERIKKYETAVFYMSTVAKYTSDDAIIGRKEMNERGRRRFLLIDADFDPGEERLSKQLRDKLIHLAKEHKSPLLIYPTASYPKKPRFRAILFVKRMLDYKSYYQGMHWLYDQLGTQPSDQFDFYITSNNNVPIFTNTDQIDAIYNTIGEEGLSPLDNAMWKEYDKPKDRVSVVELEENYSDEDDAHVFTDEQLEIATMLLVEHKEFTKYQEFWQFTTSLARAEFFEQITNDQAHTILTKIADVAPDPHTAGHWAVENIREYENTKHRVFKDREQLLRARPLVTYPEMLQVTIL